MNEMLRLSKQIFNVLPQFILIPVFVPSVLLKAKYSILHLLLLSGYRVTDEALIAETAV